VGKGFSSVRAFCEVDVAPFCHAVPALLDQLPIFTARCLRDLLEHVRVLDERIKEYGREIAQHARCDARAQLIQQRMGIGPMTASAYVANLGDGSEFKNGRQVVAWFGMVPKQNSTGGKVRLGQITRRGIGICEPYSYWAHVRCCSEPVANPIHSQSGRSRCGSGAVITVPVWPLSLRTRARLGPCCRVESRESPNSPKTNSSSHGGITRLRPMAQQTGQTDVRNT
jgi:Transposase IS116/IS110/IS902 family